jgi:hypothetical protein
VTRSEANLERRCGGSLGGSVAVLLNVPTDYVLLGAGVLLTITASMRATRLAGATHWTADEHVRRRSRQEGFGVLRHALSSLEPRLMLCSQRTRCTQKENE